jgi:hypothetical protein
MYSIVTLLYRARAQSISHGLHDRVCPLPHAYQFMSRDLRSVDKLDAGMRGVIESAQSAFSTRHVLPPRALLRICKRSPLGLNRETHRSTPASSLIDRGTDCESKGLLHQEVVHVFTGIGRLILDVFSHYFLVLQYLGGFAEYGWWCQRNRAKCVNLTRPSC